MQLNYLVKLDLIITTVKQKSSLTNQKSTDYIYYILEQQSVQVNCKLNFLHLHVKYQFSFVETLCKFTIASTKLNLYLISTTQTYKKLINFMWNLAQNTLPIFL